MTEGGMNMCEAIEEMIEDGRIEGRAEGRLEGRAEGRAESILELLQELGEIPEQTREQILAGDRPRKAAPMAEGCGKSRKRRRVLRERRDIGSIA